MSDTAANQLREIDQALIGPWTYSEIRKMELTYLKINGASFGELDGREYLGADLMGEPIARLRNALPALIAVIEAAENPHAVGGPNAQWTNDLHDALAALRDQLGKDV